MYILSFNAILNEYFLSFIVPQLHKILHVHYMDVI